MLKFSILYLIFYIFHRYIHVNYLRQHVLSTSSLKNIIFCAVKSGKHGFNAIFLLYFQGLEFRKLNNRELNNGNYCKCFQFDVKSIAMHNKD